MLDPNPNAAPLIPPRPQILALHSRLSGYFVACLNALVQLISCEVRVVARTLGDQSPYDSFSLSDNIAVSTWKDDANPELKRLPLNYTPDAILLNGWWNRDYLTIAKHYRRMGVPVIMSMDNPWNGDILQRLKGYAVQRRIRDAASHIWIPGMPQYPLAKKLGFESGQILSGYYACDTETFRPVHSSTPSRGFIYVGRLSNEKNLSGLINGYQAYARNSKVPWPLTIIGAGPLQSLVQEKENIEHIGFLQPSELPSVLRTGRAFVIASKFEPWGVAIQEAAACGLPLICSDRCGAASQYLVDWHNGLRFPPDRIDELANCLEIVSGLTKEQLRMWGRKSSEIAGSHTAKHWSETLIDAVALR